MEKVDSLLLVGTDTVASWSTGKSKVKDISLTFNGSAVSFGTLLSEPGKLTITVTNNQERSSSAEIILTIDAVYGLENVTTMQVDEETDLLQDLTFANGAELVKVEMEVDGQRTELTDPQHFTPQYPGTCSLIFTVKG